MSNTDKSTLQQDTEEHSTNFSWVKDIVLDFVSSALRATSGFNVHMTDVESVSPLDRTPQTSNSRPTPPNTQQGHGGASNVAPQRIPFQNPVEMVAKESGVPSEDGDDFHPTLASMLPDAELEKLFEMGYDSDGELAPYMTNFDDDLNDLENACDVPVGAEVSKSTTETPMGRQPAEEDQPPTDNFIMIEEPELKKLLVDQLKKELKKRGLATSGLKTELQGRLRKAMEDKIPVLQEQTIEAPAQANVFREGARWKKLTAATCQRDDPLDVFLHEPTFNVSKLGDLEHAKVKKFDFVDTFDRPPFVGTREVEKLDCFKRQKLNPETKEPQTKRFP